MADMVAYPKAHAGTPHAMQAAHSTCSSLRHNIIITAVLVLCCCLKNDHKLILLCWGKNSKMGLKGCVQRVLGDNAFSCFL